MRRYLSDFLTTSIARTLTTRWGPKIDSLINSLDDGHIVRKYRQMFCLSRMCDKQTLAVPIDCFINECTEIIDDRKKKTYILKLDDSIDTDLTSIDAINHKFFTMNLKRMCDYNYYPYMIKIQDICMYNLIHYITKKDGRFNISTDDLKKSYMRINYGTTSLFDMGIESISMDDGNVCIKVGDNTMNRISVAVSNTRYPNEESVKDLFQNQNSANKMLVDDIKQIINESVKNKVDMVVMPECFLPLNFISYAVSFCSKNNIVLVSGIQYININDTVYNYSLVALPYEDNFGQKGSLLVFHLKNHYAPKEIQHIQSLNKSAATGHGYELLCWNGVWFSLCCCHELANIHDRALFKYIVDLKVMVEYNRDINYFSNIIESLSRDIHCFCIQVNSSCYGDSRITGPYKSETKDLIKVKGGRNSTILYDVIDIGRLRDFQIDSFDNNEFKPIPPGFDRSQPKMKKYGTMFNCIQKKFDKNQNIIGINTAEATYDRS